MKLNHLTGVLTCLAMAAASTNLVACGGDTNPGEDVVSDNGVPDEGNADNVVPEDLPGDQGRTDTDQELSGDVPGDVPGDVGPQYPDAEFVNATRNSPVSVVDEPYNQWMVEYFHSTDQLASTDIRKILAYGDNVLLGTADGVLYHGPSVNGFVKAWPGAVVREGAPDYAVVDFADYLKDGQLVFVTAHGIHLFNLATLEYTEFTISGDELLSAAVTPSNGNVFVGGKAGMYLVDLVASEGLDEAVVTPVASMEGIEVRDLSSTDADPAVYVATANGLAVYTPGETLQTFTTANSALPDNNVLSLKMCPNHLAVGTETGFMIAESPANMTSISAGENGLAWGQVISIACNDDGFLLGHEMGATYLSKDLTQRKYFYGLRWMVDQTVYDEANKVSHLVGKRVPGVGLDGNGNLWLGTGFGLTRIYQEERTLADKEEVFDDMVQYFWRMGGFFSSDGWTSTPWDPPSAMRLGDKDNDGLWTQMMIGGWCFAYATTGDEKYYDYANKAMQNMFKLIDYPGVTFEAAGKERGFIARSIISQESDFIGCGGDYVNNGGSGDCPGPGEPCTVPCVEGQMNHYDYKVCCSERVYKKDENGEYKETGLRWNPIEVEGKKYVWKADTSSDEIAGHFFGFPIYYDLCAKDETERRQLRDYVSTLAGYIADNAMNLVDLDGTPTTFGVFGPDTIGIAVDGLEACMTNGYSLEACMGEYYGGAWLNSNEGVGLLLAAWHMTGDKYFYDVYEDLITTHKYYKILVPSEDTLTIVNPAIQNHSDHELAMLAYTTVLRYEPNAERLQQWKDGFKFLYDWEAPERNPWWAAVAALSGMPQPDAENARRTLRELPDDLREWLMDNCHRKDYKLNTAKDRHGDQQFTSVPPYDEIRTFWWNGNPYDCSEGGIGNSYNAPTVFLLPYYMAKYTGLITDAQTE